MSTNRFDHVGPPLVTPLHTFTKNDLATAGGKGANLGELLHAGFDIPPGYVITTVAYDLFRQS
jgi:phosphoenolpyruvate synthase/pyruvate phosphate dikinase